MAQLKTIISLAVESKGLMKYTLGLYTSVGMLTFFIFQCLTLKETKLTNSFVTD